MNKRRRFKAKRRRRERRHKWTDLSGYFASFDVGPDVDIDAYFRHMVRWVESHAISGVWRSDEAQSGATSNG